MEDRLFAFLLGELSEQEQALLESEYFEDEEKYKLLLQAREDLIEAYVSGKLSAKQREQFEVNLHNFPGQRQYVDFEEVLTEYMARKEEANREPSVPVQKQNPSLWQSITAFFHLKNFFLELSFSALAIIALFGSLWFILELTRLKSQVRELQADRTAPLQSPVKQEQIASSPERTEPSPPDLSKEPTKLTKPEDQLAQKKSPVTEPLPKTLAFTLMPDVLRSDTGSSPLILPKNIPFFEIRLGIRDKLSPDKYQARVLDANGDKLWSKDGLKIEKKGSGEFVILKLPTKIFEEDYYSIELRVPTPDGDYDTVYAYTIKTKKN